MDASAAQIHVCVEKRNGLYQPQDKQASYLSAAQRLVKLVVAAVCVVELAGGRAFVLFALLELLLLDASCQKLLQRHLGLEVAWFELTKPPP